MKNIVIKVGVSDFYSTYNVNVSDLGCSDEEWDKLTQEQKEKEINTYVIDLPEQPYFVVNYFYEQ